jgi:hypothetical protein
MIATDLSLTAVRWRDRLSERSEPTPLVRKAKH